MRDERDLHIEQDVAEYATRSNRRARWTAGMVLVGNDQWTKGGDSSDCQQTTNDTVDLLLSLQAVVHLLLHPSISSKSQCSRETHPFFC